MSRPSRQNRRVVTVLIGVLLTMGGLTWAAVPFYSWFCRTTGYGGATVSAAAAPDRVLEESITIRFDANTAAGMPWEFRPVQSQMTLRIGETGMAFFEAYNPTDRVVAGTATFNVAPDSAGGYFTKIDCFCFTEQVLKPGERVQMPVTFYVDPAIKQGGDASFLREIILSYTFYETDVPEDQASLLATGGETGQRTGSN